MSFSFQRHYTGLVKGIIFDYAGTTVDYGCMAPAAVFVDVFKRNGIDISMAEARIPMGLNKKEHIRAIFNLPGVQSRLSEDQQKMQNEDHLEKMYREFIPMQVEAIANHSDLIPGVSELAEYLREEGIRYAGTTGYNREMLKVILEATKDSGFLADANFTSDDVPAGRPKPWMCLQAAMALDAYPMEALIKVGDTIPDIDAGLNANMWTVAVIKTGNELGMTVAETEAMPLNEIDDKLTAIENKMLAAGAHFVIDSVVELPEVIEEIEDRLALGMRP
jgi:phosphonoacetaldehyde hydrolase